MTRTVGKGIKVAAAGAALMGIFSLAGCGGGSPAGETIPTTGDGTTASAPVLSDTGLGELKLGISLAQAEATGLVGEPPEPGMEDEACAQYGGKGGVEYLYFADDQLIIIAVGPTIRLDTGVGIGDSFAALNKAYGDRIGRDEGLQRFYVTAPEATIPAHYRIGIDTETAFRDSKITEIALQSTEQPCYE